MTIERTFSMIKPDATDRNLVGSITAMIEESGLKVTSAIVLKDAAERVKEAIG